MSSQQLADQFKPIVYFHPRELHFPVNVETYLASCDVLDQKDGTIILAGPLSSTIMNTNKGSIPDGATLKVMESKEEEIKSGIAVANINSVPFYCRINQTTEFIYLTYVFVYGYNWNYPVFFNLFPTGEHWSDFEHVTMELDATTTELKRVYYGAHRQADGKWLNAADVKMTSGRVTVYSSRGSHGCYYNESFYLRVGGFANDTVGSLTSWIADSVLLVYDDTEPEFVATSMGFLTFNGTWGNGKVTGMQRKFFWNAPETGGQSSAPWASPINILTEWFIVAIVASIVIALSIWGIVESTKPKSG